MGAELDFHSFDSILDSVASKLKECIPDTHTDQELYICIYCSFFSSCVYSNHITDKHGNLKKKQKKNSKLMKKEVTAPNILL